MQREAVDVAIKPRDIACAAIGREKPAARRNAITLSWCFRFAAPGVVREPIRLMALEGIILAVGVISLLSLVIVSRNYTEAGAADVFSIETLGAVAVNGNFLAYNVAMAGSAWAACSSAI